MYVEHSLRGDSKKKKLMDELNFKNCMRFKRNTTSEVLVGVIVKGRNFIIHAEYFDAKNIFSHRFIKNLKHRPNVVQDLSTPMNKVI